jgi:hypothetical protein
MYETYEAIVKKMLRTNPKELNNFYTRVQSPKAKLTNHIPKSMALKLKGQKMKPEEEIEEMKRLEFVLKIKMLVRA